VLPVVAPPDVAEEAAVADEQPRVRVLEAAAAVAPEEVAAVPDARRRVPVLEAVAVAAPEEAAVASVLKCFARAARQAAVAAAQV
jgi:hypothetical protein